MMKRWIALFMSIMLMFSLAACGTDYVSGVENPWSLSVGVQATPMYMTGCL